MGTQNSDPGFKPNLYVVARMLEKLLNSRDQKLRPTQLQMKAGLNWKIFTKYLELLKTRKLATIEKQSDGEYITITHKGRNTYKSIINAMSKVLGENWIQKKRRKL